MSSEATAGGVLARVLNRSLTFSERVTWLSPEAAAMDAAHKDLLAAYDKIGTIEPEWDGLAERYEKLTAAIKVLEGRKVGTDAKARSAHTKKLEGLLPRVQKLAAAVADEPGRLADLEKQRVGQLKSFAAHQGRIEPVLKREIGEGTPPSTRVVRDLTALAEKLSTAGQRPTTSKHMGDLQGRVDKLIDAWTARADEYEQQQREEAEAAAAAQEKARRAERDAEREAERKRVAAEQAKLQQAWRDELTSKGPLAMQWKSCKTQIPVIAAANRISPTDFTPLLRELRANVKLVLGFDPEGRPEHEKLTTALERIEALGEAVTDLAQTSDARNFAAMEAAVDMLTRVVSERAPVGSKPKPGEVTTALKECAVPKILKSDVEDMYADRHEDTPPQQKLAAARAEGAAGEQQKWQRITPWMRALGYGGSPRTGPHGPVFLASSSKKIGGFTIHFSQFMANAGVPAAHKGATVDEAMDALFGDASGTIGPHVTQEREGYGSPQNARFFKGSNVFRSGGVPPADEATTRAAMSKAMATEMGRVRTRLTAICEG